MMQTILPLSPGTMPRSLFQATHFSSACREQKQQQGHQQQQLLLLPQLRLTVRNEHQEKAIRTKMVQRLYHQLQTKYQQQQPVSSSSSSVDTYQAALALEQLLYRSAYNFDEYQNLYTLKERLRSILAIRLCRRTLQKDKTRPGTSTSNNGKVLSSAIPDRITALSEALGSAEKYHETKTLVQAIQSAKLQMVATMKGGCHHNTKSSTTCPLPSLMSRNTYHHHHHHHSELFPGDAPFPEPIRDLFFHTSLVQAFERTPREKLSTLNWPHMIQEAHCHLQAFQEYNNHHQDLNI